MHNNNELNGFGHHDKNSISTDLNEVKALNSRIRELELKLTAAEKEKAVLQATNAKFNEENRILKATNVSLNEENRTLLREIGKYEGIQIDKNEQRLINMKLNEKIEQLSRELGKREGAQEILLQLNITDVEDPLVQNSQFMLRNEEIDSKTDYGHCAKDEGGVEGGFLNNTEIDEVNMTLSGSGSDNTQFIPSFDAFEDYSIQAHSNSGAHSPIKQDANKQESAEGKISRVLRSSGSKMHRRTRSRNIEKCDLCPKIFPNKSQLQRHYRSHTGEKSYQCNQCPKAFGRKDALVRHIRGVHFQQKGNMTATDDQNI